MSPDPPSTAPRPKVFRSMKKDPADGLPIVGSGSSSHLGVRAGTDITVDSNGDVVLDGTGMSVAPDWRKLEFTRIPRRLRPLMPDAVSGATGAFGPNSLTCFSMGTGPFERGGVAAGLELIPDPGQDPVNHGVVAPTRAVPLADYGADLANTRNSWQIDEA